MRRLLPLAVLSLFLAGALSPARACINDREVEKAEHEFKSSYNAQPDYPEQPEQQSSPETERKELLFGGLGIALLSGATLVTARKAVNR